MGNQYDSISAILSNSDSHLFYVQPCQRPLLNSHPFVVCFEHMCIWQAVVCGDGRKAEGSLEDTRFFTMQHVL